MFKTSNICLFYLVLVTWLFGGGFVYGPYLVGGGGLLCLVLALNENRAYANWRRSWKLLPWCLWIVLICVSLINPSHQSEKEDLGREFTTPHGEARDTIGSVNPSVPVDHIEWLPTTPDAARSGIYLFVMIGIFAFALALLILPMNRSEVRRWLTYLFCNSLLLTLLGLWWFFEDRSLLFGKFPTEGAQPFASFHYKNCWTAYAILSSAIGIGMASYWWKAGKDLFRAKSPTSFFVFTCPLILLTLPLIQARAGVFIGTLLAIWVGVFVWNGYRKSERRAPWALVCLAVAVGVLGWFSWSTTAPEIQRMLKKSGNQLEQVTANEPTGRMVLFEDTKAMAEAKPWFGWGLASFSQVYPVFQNPRLYRKLNLKGGDFVWLPSYYEFAHCDWIQYWAETGIIGLVLLLGTPVLWAVYYMRRGRANALSHWLGVGCVLVLVLAWFEFPFGSEAVSLLFAACLALAGKYALLTEKRRSRRKRRHKKEIEELRAVENRRLQAENA